MVDACTVGRPGEPVLNEGTGVLSPSLAPVYSGACKFQATISSAANPVSGEHRFTVQDLRFDLPVSAGPLAVNDLVTVTASLLDPQLVGRVYRVAELFHKSFATAQRSRVEEVVA